MGMGVVIIQFGSHEDTKMLRGPKTLVILLPQPPAKASIKASIFEACFARNRTSLCLRVKPKSRHRARNTGQRLIQYRFVRGEADAKARLAAEGTGGNHRDAMVEQVQA